MLQYIPFQILENCSSPAQTSSVVKEKHIENYSYDLSALLGEGSYSQVFKGKDNTTDTPVAIKVIDRRKVHNPYVLKMIQQETLIMGHLNNTNIVRVYEVVNTVNNIYIIQEYCDGGDISNEVETRKFTEKEVFRILYDILNALAVLQSNGIMHRDIKPANIFLNKGVYKLGDFGFARMNDYSQEPLEDFLVGTPLYMSPQCLQSVPYTEKTDMWSLGITVYELLYGEVPWLCSSHQELLNAIYTKTVKFPRGINPDLKRFIARCLVIDEGRRMGLADAVEMARSWKGDTETNSCSELQESEKSDKKNVEMMVRSDEKTVRADSDNISKNFTKFCQVAEDVTPTPQPHKFALKGHKNSTSWDENAVKLILGKTNSNNANKNETEIQRTENFKIECEEIFQNHMNYARFVERLKDLLKNSIKSLALTEKETTKLNMLIFKSWMHHLQQMLVVFRDRVNMFYLEKWEEFMKSEQFENFSKETHKLYEEAVKCYKEFVGNFYNRMDLLREITQDEKVNEVLLGDTSDNKTFYSLLLKEVKQFIREINHVLYERLKITGVFNKNQAKFLFLLVKFNESLLRIVKNQGEIPKFVGGEEDFEVDVSKEFYCQVLRNQIYEMNI